MDLDHKQIEDLLPFLQHFVKTAKLPDRESPEPEVVGKARHIEVNLPSRVEFAFVERQVNPEETFE